MRLYLIRHAEAENIDLTVYDRKMNEEIDLTENGIEQANKAGKTISKKIGFISHHNPVKVFSSTYERSYKTAKIICSFLSHSVLKKEILLVEQGFGIATGADSFESFASGDQVQEGLLKKLGKTYAQLPQGESRLDVSVRAELFLSKILRSDIDNTIVISHAVFCAMMHSQITGDYKYEMWKNAEIRYYDFYKNQPLYWNGLNNEQD